MTPMTSTFTADFRNSMPFLTEKDLLGLLQGIQLFQFRLDRLKGQQRSHLEKTASEAGQKPHKDDRAGKQHRLDQHAVGHGLERLGKRLRVERRRQQDEVLDLTEKPIPGHGDRRKRRRHQHRRRHILTLRDLPLLPRIAQPLLGRLFCFFSGHGAVRSGDVSN
jgi:hypothetical protein